MCDSTDYKLNCLALENISYSPKSTSLLVSFISFVFCIFFSPLNITYNTNIIYITSHLTSRFLSHFTQTDMHCVKHILYYYTYNLNHFTINLLGTTH